MITFLILNFILLVLAGVVSRFIIYRITNSKD